MTSEINPNKNIINQNWNSHLEKGAYKGRKIEKMAKALMGKEASDLNDNGKSITYGKHILDLDQLVSSKDSSLSYSYLKHKIRLNVSKDYKKTHQAEISNFAKLIEEKLKIRNISAESKETSQNQEVKKVKSLPKPEIKKQEVKEVKSLPKPDIQKQEVEKVQKVPSPSIPDDQAYNLLLNAIQNQDINEVKNLIKQGVNPNVHNSEGRTPLMMATVYLQLDIAKELIPHVNINTKDINGFDAIMYGAFRGSSEAVSLLLENGADPNSKNNYGETLLMVAAQEEKSAPLLVNLLLQAGADINLQSSEGYDALRHYVAKGNFDVAKTLIEHGADLNRLYKTRTILDQIKEERIPGYKNLVKIIKEKNPELQKRHTEFKHRLRIAHAWHLEGESALHENKMNLEGSSFNVSYNLMQKNIRQFEQFYPKLTNQDTLEEAFKTASLQNHNNVSDVKTNMDILINIRKGLPTFINTGYLGHAVILLVWKDQLVVCNRGGESRMPIEVYHYDSKYLDIETIESLRVLNKTGTRKDYVDLVQTNLKEKIKLSQSPLDLYLQKAKTLPDQIVGNCSWVSPITGVYALHLLSAASGEEAEKMLSENNPVLKESIKKQVKEYRTWIGFEQIATLENMMKVVGTTGYEPDYKLIEDALERAYSFRLDDVLSEKLKALTGAYVKAIPEANAGAFNQKLSVWQAESVEKKKIPL